MFERKYLVDIPVSGRNHTWTVRSRISEKQWRAMDEDGILVGWRVYSIPLWAMKYHLVPLCCFVQDIWDFRNPFSKKPSLPIKIKPEKK